MFVHHLRVPANQLFRIFAITALLLAVPFFAMRVTNEVNWNVGDFIVAACLLIGFGYLYSITTLILSRRFDSPKMIRAVVGSLLTLTLITVWVILALELI